MTVVANEPATVETFDNASAKPKGVLKKPKTSRKPKTESAEPNEKKLSCLNAAIKVLGESGEPMNTKEMIEAMESKGYWTSPGGKTPHATLYSAILRELAKGDESRFVKLNAAFTSEIGDNMKTIYELRDVNDLADGEQAFRIANHLRAANLRPQAVESGTVEYVVRDGDWLCAKMTTGYSFRDQRDTGHTSGPKGL